MLRTKPGSISVNWSAIPPKLVRIRNKICWKKTTLKNLPFPLGQVPADAAAAVAAGRLGADPAGPGAGEGGRAAQDLA
jgi:hypothetical protein